MAVKRLILVLCAALASVLALAQLPSDYGKRMGIDQRLGEQVPTDLRFYDDAGQQIKFGDLLGKRPVIVFPIFYTCQSVCDIEEQEIVAVVARMYGKKSAYKDTQFKLGQDFDIIFFSINPEEKYDVAHSRAGFLRDAYAAVLKGKTNGSEVGFHFLTAVDPADITKMTDALGFHYVWDAPNHRVYHPAGAMVLTPEGRISKYFYGADYPTNFIESAVTDASQNKIGAKANVILLGCISIDPVTGKRTLVVKQVVNVACVFTVIVLASWICLMTIQTKREEAARKLLEGAPKNE
ncbi:MAG: SCO family protein [Armatimonadetes bacterium]|nr:SCO family protein [Armatimonadota bacterium]